MEEEALSRGSHGWPRRPISAFPLTVGGSLGGLEVGGGLSCCNCFLALGATPGWLDLGGRGGAEGDEGSKEEEGACNWEGLDWTAAAAAAAAWLRMSRLIEEMSTPFRANVAENAERERLNGCCCFMLVFCFDLSFCRTQKLCDQ